MTRTPESTREGTLSANMQVHAFLVQSGEYQRSPHFRPENQAKVRGILQRITSMLPDRRPRSVVDFGCGTGFLIDLLHDLFDEVHGVDITPEMMRQVDLRGGKVQLHECQAERTPFAENQFDFATAYSFMDHLYDYRDFLREVHRVLRPGGVFYSDLNPNRGFISAIQAADRDRQAALPDLVAREVQGALHNGAHYQQNFGLDANLLEQAEPIKSHDGGFLESEVLSCARELGFTDCRVEYEWFLGQGKVLHEQSAAAADLVDNYLRSVLPVSAGMYKYLRFVFVK
jgi:SAM-dependent methyltransferase